MPMPSPEVRDLEPENYIDLDKLGSADLTTYITYPAMISGSQFWPNWRGCSATGAVVDFFDNVIDSNVAYPNQMPVTVSNAMLRALDQGWVFYSYQLFDITAPANRGEESLRRFFYVGKRVASGSALSVPQCKESHDLCLDPAVLTSLTTVSIVTVPYRAMQKDDRVTLKLDMYFEVGDPYKVLQLSKTLTAEEVGQPLQWPIEADELLIIKDGYALMSYSIEYARPTVPTTSAQQTLNIIAPPPTPLPALSIKGLTSDWLDPEDWPDGVTLVIPLYSGIQTGDDVLLYVTGGLAPLVKTLKVDPSTIASDVLHLNLEYQWLFQNQGRTVELLYQYARVGKAGTSEPLTLPLRRKQDLPPPLVKGAVPEGDGYQGYILARNATSGVTIDVPEEVEIADGDTLKMHWEGYSDAGSHVAEPILSNPKRFLIPAAAVPANMNKRVNVYYTLAPSGEDAAESNAYDLGVRAIDSGWPALQGKEPPVTNRELPLDEVPEQGATFELGSWTYMAQGQRVRIKATGLLNSGGNERIDLRVGDDERVTADEYNEGKLSVRVPRMFLSSLKLNEVNLSITVETSFDEGAYYFPFPALPDLKVTSAATSSRKVNKE